MNKVWFFMVVSSLCLLVWTNPSSALQNMTTASASALKYSFELVGIYAVWLGIIELVDASGLGQKLAHLLRPLIKKLFKVDDEETQKYIAMNMSANILGLGNAATPMGIAAMKKLDDGNEIANHSIIMLIIINSTSIQLLPTTIIGLRAAAGSNSPADIIIPTLIVSALTFCLGIILAKICEKIYKKVKK